MRNTPETRLRAILSYAFSGQRSYAACDIPTRDQIDSLIPKIMKATDGPARAAARLFVNTWGEQIDNGESISGADAVEFMAGFLGECRAVCGGGDK